MSWGINNFQCANCAKKETCPDVKLVSNKLLEVNQEQHEGAGQISMTCVRFEKP